MKRHALLLGTVALLLAGCDTTDRAIFVTSTNIGINADATTRVVNLGYDRTEGFIGPDYVDNGAAPPVIGYLQSNLEVFSPKVKQLYATGRAAEIVTMSEPPTTPEQPDQLDGTRRLLLFGTSSNVGFKLGFATASGLPDSITFGYKRKEMSVIPFNESAPQAPAQDHYAPVLASIDMDQATDTLPTSKLRLTQFVATGMAARNLARNPEIRGMFNEQAAVALTQASVNAEATRTTTADIVQCVAGPNGTVDSARLNAILTSAVKAGKITDNQKGNLSDATTTAQLQGRLYSNPILRSSLSDYAKNSGACAK